MLKRWDVEDDADDEVRTIAPCDSNFENWGTFCPNSVFIVFPSYQPVECGGGAGIDSQRDTIDGRGWISGPSQIHTHTMKQGLQLFCDWGRQKSRFFYIPLIHLLCCYAAFLSGNSQKTIAGEKQPKDCKIYSWEPPFTPPDPANFFFLIKINNPLCKQF